MAAGTRTLVATSHVSWEYPNRADTIARLVAELDRRLGGEGLALEIRAGAEIAMTRLADTPSDELARLTLGGGRWLLVEPPFTLASTGLDALVADLQDRGYRVVLAHPERCPAFHRDRSMLEALVDAGALGSLTAGSLVGRFGKAVRRFSLELVRDGLVHNVASDAHDAKPPPADGRGGARAGRPRSAHRVAHAGRSGRNPPWRRDSSPAAVRRRGAPERTARVVAAGSGVRKPR